MRLVIVPDALRQAIHAKIDAALLSLPAEAAAHREQFYSELLAYYDERGSIPSFTVAATGTPTPTDGRH
jgi:hypothetical protein